MNEIVFIHYKCRLCLEFFTVPVGNSIGLPVRDVLRGARPEVHEDCGRVFYVGLSVARGTKGLGDPLGASELEPATQGAGEKP